MSDQVPDKSAFATSANTNVSTVGAFFAALIMWALGERKVFFPAGFEALLAGFIVAALGYVTEVMQALLKKLKE